MTFTSTPPTEPGAYWWKPLEAFEEAELKEVWTFTTGALMTTDLNKNGVPVSYVSGFWSSRLVPLDEYVEKGEVEKAFREGMRATIYMNPPTKKAEQLTYDNSWLSSHAKALLDGKEQKI